MTWLLLVDTGAGGGVGLLTSARGLAGGAAAAGLGAEEGEAVAAGGDAAAAGGTGDAAFGGLGGMTGPTLAVRGGGGPGLGAAGPTGTLTVTAEPLDEASAGALGG